MNLSAAKQVAQSLDQKLEKTGEGSDLRLSFRREVMPSAARREATAYFTDDVDDAVNTARAQYRWLRAGGR